MKKILILSNHPDYTYNFRKEIILSLLNNGYEVLLACPYGEKIQPLMEEGCKFKEINFNRHGKNPFKELFLFLKYFKLIKKFQPNVTLSYTIKPNLYGGLACRMLRIPFMPNITGLGSSMQKKSALTKTLMYFYKISFKNAQTIFFQNKDNYNYFFIEKITGKNNILLPGSGVNIKDFPYEEYPNNDEMIITYSGRIMKDKGVFELLEAIEQINNRDLPIKFRFIGFIEKEKNLEEVFLSECKRLGVKYFGYQDNIHEFIAETDAIILPSHSEGMSNTLLEAASMGRPLLGSNISGINEIIEDNVNGYLFEKESKEDIVRAIIKFSELNRDERKKMGKKSREKIMKEFDRALVVKAYNEQIRKIGE